MVSGRTFGSVMDRHELLPVIERIQRLSDKIKVVEGHQRLTEGLKDEYLQEWTRKLSSSRVNKYRYKNQSVLLKSVEGQKIISEPKRAVESAGPGYGTVDLFDRGKFMKELGVFVDGTRLAEVSWDSKFINPVQLVAHGWIIEGYDGSVLNLLCRSCKSRWSVDLNNSELNEEYLKQLSKKHDVSCVWSGLAIPLGNVYEINKGNIVYEIERINRDLNAFKGSDFQLGFTVPEMVEKLAKSFNAETHLGLFYLLLRGYSVINADILESVGSFTKVLTKDVLKDASFNGHPNWSNYYNQDRVIRLLYDAMMCEISGKCVEEKLSYFKNVLSDF